LTIFPECYRGNFHSSSRVCLWNCKAKEFYDVLSMLCREVMV